MTADKHILQRERIDGFAGYGLLLILVYCVFPYLTRCIEFSHNDIVYNYVPYREWLIARMREPTHPFPLWDSWTGIGRFLEIWTTIPIDILTPLELANKHIEFAELFSMQLAVLFLVAFVAFRALKFSPALSTLGCVLFYLAPVTSYFIFFYVHGWAFAFYVGGFTSIYLFLKSGRPSFLLLTFLSSLLFSLGTKTELLFLNLCTLGLSSTIYVLLFASDRRLKRLVYSTLALFVPFLLHAWAFNLILLSAKYSMRPPSSPSTWQAFFHSMGSLFIDPMFDMLVANTLLFIMARWFRWFGSKTWRACAFSTGFFSLISSVYFAGFGAGGFSAGISAAVLSLFLGSKEDRAKGPANLLKAQILIYYFLRPFPGEVDEILLLQLGPWAAQIPIGFFSVYGLCSSQSDLLKRWCVTVLGSVVFLRTIGFVLLSHSVGMLWLPARDNYLLDFPVAILALMGMRFFLNNFLGFWIRRDWEGYIWFSLPLLLSFAIVLSHPRFAMFPATSRRPLLSETLREQTATLSKYLGLEDNGLSHRVLSLFHGFGRLYDLDDVREYQSLTTGRYGRYSISERLKIPLPEIANLATVTGSVSPHFRSLMRPVPQLETLTQLPIDKIDFYYNYVVNAVPPLDCDQIRLLGIEYIEAAGGVYHHLSQFYLNNIYSLMGPREEQLQPDVMDKVALCNFKTVRIGKVDYWKVDQPMPRAFVIQGAPAGILIDQNLRNIKMGSSKIEIGGQEYSWIPAQIASHRPNDIDITVKSAEPGLLVLTELYNPLWQAAIDGIDAKLESAFFLYRGVYVDKGEHSVRLELEHPRLSQVKEITALGLLLSMLLLICLWRQKPFTNLD